MGGLECLQERDASPYHIVSCFRVAFSYINNTLYNLIYMASFTGYEIHRHLPGESATNHSWIHPFQIRSTSWSGRSNSQRHCLCRKESLLMNSAIFSKFGGIHILSFEDLATGLWTNFQSGYQLKTVFKAPIVTILWRINQSLVPQRPNIGFANSGMFKSPRWPFVDFDSEPPT